MNLSSETFSETYTYEDNKKILVKLCNLFFQKLEKMLQSTLKLWKIKNLNDYVKYQVNNRQKTVEKTKFLANFYKSCFEEACNELNVAFNPEEGNGYDCIINNIKYEMKFTSSEASEWTGNCYSNVKVNNYILLKAYFNDNNIIEKAWAGILNCKFSSWSKPKNKNNNTAFSNLKIDIRDENNLQILIGDIRSKTKYLYIIPSKI